MQVALAQLEGVQVTLVEIGGMEVALGENEGMQVALGDVGSVQVTLAVALGEIRVVSSSIQSLGSKNLTMLRSSSPSLCDLWYYL